MFAFFLFAKISIFYSPSIEINNKTHPYVGTRGTVCLSFCIRSKRSVPLPTMQSKYYSNIPVCLLET